MGHLQHTPSLKDHNTSQKIRHKDSKSKKVGEDKTKQCLLNTAGYWTYEFTAAGVAYTPVNIPAWMGRGS